MKNIKSKIFGLFFSAAIMHTATACADENKFNNFDNLNKAGQANGIDSTVSSSQSIPKQVQSGPFFPRSKNPKKPSTYLPLYACFLIEISLRSFS